MSQNAISRELALRIGLCARALPDTDAKRLLDVLAKFAGKKLNQAKLATLTVASFKALSDGEFSAVDDITLQQALNILQTPVNVTDGEPLSIEAYQDGDMPNSIRIACASDNNLNIDGHFGSCNKFLIYQINTEESRLIDIRMTQMPDKGVEDKNLFRAQLIKDCQLLYVASVGGPAAAKIVKTGIHPVKTPSKGKISDTCDELQQVLNTPPPWLAKVMGFNAEDRVRFEME